MSSKNKIIIIGTILIIILFTAILLLIIPKVKIDIIGDKIVNLNIGDVYIEEGATAYIDEFGVKKELDVEVQGKVDTSNIGKFIITYKVIYKNHEYNKIRIVNVIDTEKPLLTLNKNPLICKKNNLIEIDATAIDNLDGDISDQVKYNIKNNKIYIFVKDSSNNKEEMEKDIVYMDDEKPIITIKGNKTIYITEGEKYSDQGATATDSCDGDISGKIKTTGNVDTNNLGEYTIVYKVSDSVNNETIATRKVIVISKNVESTNNNSGVIYLTFDDGPGPYTEQILDILSQNNIKATFFVTNQLGSKYQYIIKKEYELGHTVGIHTYSHKWAIYDSVEDYLNDFEKIREIVVSQTGVEPKYFRFPGGTSNHIAKISMANLAKLMAEKGYVYFDWSVSVEDAGSCTKKKKDSEREKCIFNYFKEGLKKDKSNIVLMHDIKKSTLGALPEMIEYAKKNGYSFKQIDESTPLKQFTPYK